MRGIRVTQAQEGLWIRKVDMPYNLAFSGCKTSSQDVIKDVAVDVSQAEVAALVAVGEALVVDT